MIKKSLEKADKQKVEIGYFANQGKHTGADGISDYSYAGLAQALELGFFPVQGEFRQPMPFMKNILNLTVKKLPRSQIFLRARRKWVKKLHKNGNPQILLDAIGRIAIMQSRVVFGNPAYFPQAPDNKTPNFHTGELMSHFTYRTTFDNRVRKT